MSVRAMTEVWSRDLPATVILTALALADHADHDGCNAYPSVRLLAWKTSQSRRTVQRHLRDLAAAGFIVADAWPRGGHGHATRYHFDFAAVPEKHAYRDQPAQAGEPNQSTLPDPTLIRKEA